MFPEWDDDGEEDEKVVNIVRAFYGHFKNPWVWSHSHWPREGVKASKNKAVVKQEAGQGVKRAADTTEEDSSSSKKARTEASFAEFEMRLTVSLTNALVSRLDSFERRVDLRFGDLGCKMDVLSSRVEWVYAKLAAFRGQDPEKNSITDAEKTKGGPTDGVSVPLSLPSLLNPGVKKQRTSKRRREDQPAYGEKVDEEEGNAGPRKSARIADHDGEENK